MSRSLTCSFLCFVVPVLVSSTLSLQFARHGDKVSEKKEQNVRVEKAFFVFVIVLVFNTFSLGGEKKRLGLKNTNMNIMHQYGIISLHIFAPLTN